MEIQRLDTGLYTMEKDGILYGSIYSDQPAGGIAQSSPRAYTACFWPAGNNDTKGFKFCGDLAACKHWLYSWSSIIA